jgi:DNA mismatch endonuclease (patch repair protein)
MAIRRELHRRGLRYRVNVRPIETLRCRADVVFPRQRVAVFIDGCFWHSCPDHGTSPSTNSDYWRAKLARNLQRDAANNAALAEGGWRVLRVWEHEQVHMAADAIECALRAGPR